MNKSEKYSKRPRPTCLLFDSELWNKCKSNLKLKPVGLQNLGNTCFINSALQCLSYTPALIDYLFGYGHRKHCKIKEYCCLCQLQKLIEEMENCNGLGFVPPITIFNRLKATCNMEPGQQQDSHEFLRYLIDRMTNDSLNEFKDYTGIERETTAIHQIFGGYLRSEVKCYTCKNKCFTYDLFMDLSVDVKHMKTLGEALRKYVKPEVLKNGNAYYCRTCQSIMKAKKTMTIYRAPNILTLHFKRFKFVNRPQRIQNTVEYDLKLNIKDFMTKSKSEDVNYELYAVLLHHSHHANGGHYTCYVKHNNNTWFHLNDAKVNLIPEEKVINDSDAYVLFYKRSKMNFWNTYSDKKIICSEDSESTNDNVLSEKDEPKTSTPILFNENNTLPSERPKISFAIRPHFTTRFSGMKTFNGRLMTPINSLIDDDSDSEKDEGLIEDKNDKESSEIESNSSATLLSNFNKTYEESFKLFPDAKGSDDFSNVCDQVGNLMKDWSEMQSPPQDFSFDDQIPDFTTDPILIERNEKKTTQASWKSLWASIDAGLEDQSRQSPTTEKLMALKQLAKENAGEIKDNGESAPQSSDVTSSVSDAQDKCSSQECVKETAEKKSRVGVDINEKKGKATTKDNYDAESVKQRYQEFNLAEKLVPTTKVLPVKKKKSTAISTLTSDISNSITKTIQKLKNHDKPDKKQDIPKKKLKDRKKFKKERKDKKYDLKEEINEKFLQSDLLLDAVMLEDDEIIPDLFDSPESSNIESSKEISKSILSYDNSNGYNMDTLDALNAKNEAMETDSQENGLTNVERINICDDTFLKSSIDALHKYQDKFRSWESSENTSKSVSRIV